jgi:hypothetical protein
MTSPLNTQDETTAFLEACIHKRRALRDIWESLGLFSQQATTKDPDFHNPLANELHGNIKQIAESFAASYNGALSQLQADLAEPHSFFSEVTDLGRRFGEPIWGRLEDGEITSSGEPQGRGIEEHHWNDLKSRKT